MKILVDADACPVKEIIRLVANQYHIDVTMFADTSHCLDDALYNVVTVDKAADSVDLKIINNTVHGDIVITQDYGLAALVLGKKAYAINNNGLVYSDNNIDRLLFERHLTKKQLRSGGRPSTIRKRNTENDLSFEKSLRTLIEKVMNQ